MVVVESVGAVSLSRDRYTAKEIEAAMSAAVAECYAEGITDTAVIHSRMLDARQHVKDRLH